MPGETQQRKAVLHGRAGQRMPGMRKRLSAGMGTRHAASVLRRRLPYPVVDGLPSVFGGKAPVVRVLRAGAARGSEKVLQPCLLSQSHGGNTPPAGMRVVRGRLFSLCRGRTPVLLPELRQCRPNCAKEFPQDSSYRTGELDTLPRTNSLIWPLITSSFS